MINAELARVFSQMADLMEIKGADRFRINAYRTAARSIMDCLEDVAELAGQGKLQKIPGIGKGTAAKVEEYLANGCIAAHLELLASYPAGLRQLMDVRGLGPRKIEVLYRELKVGCLEDLKAAIADGRVAGLKGFGEKTAKNILEALEFLDRAHERTPLGIAAPLAAQLREAVAAMPNVRRVEIAGSLRRGRDTVADIDLLCVADNGPQVIATFTKLPRVSSVLAAGDTKGSCVVETLKGGGIQADLRVVPAESFGAAMQYFTGSKEHNVRLREMAVRRGWRLNEYGLLEGESRIAGEDEVGIYSALGLPFIPPELREDRGEFDRPEGWPDLIRREDMVAELHLHTTASDGRLELEEMVEACRALGYRHMAVTDHSKSSVIANGLSVDRLLAQMETIRKLNRRLKDFTILVGTECDVLPNGRLDFPDEVLAQLDWVVASVHAGQRGERAAQTRRTIAAIENPYVCAIGHPSGRLIGRREPMDLDFEQIIAAAARTGTALEVNSSWHRLDLKDQHVRQAVEAGCWLTINTDAHSASDLQQMGYGIQTARRGWAARPRVLNTLSVEELRRWVHGKRRRTM
ncbi:MAG: DNA polymerase/3'-5' exonuclease PolX [Phycisphaerae bacterium]